MVIKIQFVTDLTLLEDQMKLEGKEDLKSGAFVSSLFYVELHLERETSNSPVGIQVGEWEKITCNRLNRKCLYLLP